MLIINDKNFQSSKILQYLNVRIDPFYYKVDSSKKGKIYLKLHY